MAFESIPVFQEDVVNDWDIRLANVPMNLTIQAGAYDGEIELGGLSLKSLTVSEGGSDLIGSFSEPNLVEMSTFTYSTGGSAMILKGLANANFAQMNFDCGAGDYTLNFDGQLQRDAEVTIQAGAGTVSIIIPQDTNARLTFDGAMTTINNEGWEQNENVYTLSGDGPTLHITVEMGLGTLNLKTE
jgi:hypothetical protein